jgi:hypothetical protein
MPRHAKLSRQYIYPPKIFSSQFLVFEIRAHCHNRWILTHLPSPPASFMASCSRPCLPLSAVVTTSLRDRVGGGGVAGGEVITGQGGGGGGQPLGFGFQEELLHLRRPREERGWGGASIGGGSGRPAEEARWPGSAAGRPGLDGRWARTGGGGGAGRRVRKGGGVAGGGGQRVGGAVASARGVGGGGGGGGRPGTSRSSVREGEIAGGGGRRAGGAAAGSRRPGWRTRQRGGAGGSTSSVLKKLTFMTATQSPKYNFDLLLLQKYLSNSDVCIVL